MRKMIINELERLRATRNYLWTFKQWIAFYNELNPKEQEMFSKEIMGLISNGILIEERDGSVINYRLTDKGFDIIYS